MAGRAEVGLTGLAVMGQNLARNVARHGIPIVVHNRTTARTRELLDRHGHEGPMTGATTVEEFVGALARPRRIIIMVKAGPPVDAVVDELVPHLEPGDVLIDGGNSWFEDTRRREQALQERGLHFLGTGISGGEEGALNGPSIMPGGSREGYAAVEGVLTTIAAKVDGVPCCTYVGPDGAGHYVKMVHNGIEYADMQLIAESYDLLGQALSLGAAELAEIFDDWNRGDLESFLIETTAKVLRHVDAATGRPLVDVILDEAEQKGTGRWAVHSALDLGVPITGITEAVFARMLSARKDERVAAAKVLPGPAGQAGPDAAGRLVDEVHGALYASKVVAYAQGFEQMAAASEEYGWGVDLGAMATIWRGGCIIRARFLDRIASAFRADPALRNLLLADYFRDAVAGAQEAWRRVSGAAVELGVPVPAFASSLAYYDGYRRERLPANLVQGLRDYFGAHTYRRIDRPGTFHTLWSEDGREVEVDAGG
jgi:6-phosphogluconate dehydrogenase